MDIVTVYDLVFGLVVLTVVYLVDEMVAWKVELTAIDVVEVKGCRLVSMMVENMAEQMGAWSAHMMVHLLGFLPAEELAD